LDAVTLKKLKSFRPPSKSQLLAFSPESHLLTWFGGWPGVFISWDLQTGVLVSRIPIAIEDRPAGDPLSITHSACETMFGVLFTDSGEYAYDGYGSDDAASISTDGTTIDICDNVIGVYDIHSGIPLYYHPIKGVVTGTIWTHGECIQFATFGQGTITTWEVGFTSKDPPTEVKSLPIPDNFHPSEQFLLLPTLSRLAFVFQKTILVLDIQHSKLLLNSADHYLPTNLTFSSDGHFFACGSSGPEIYLWKESPAGYALYQTLVSGVERFYKPLLSPDGQSIAVASGPTIQLLQTTDPTTSPSSILTQACQPKEHSILGFSPDGSLAATTQFGNFVVAVLDLKSGVTRLMIDTGMGVYGLRVAGDTIIVVGNGKVITWNLPTGDHVPGAWADINDSIQTTTFHHSGSFGLVSASISPDLNYIATMWRTPGLCIYSMSTGQHLAENGIQGGLLWFSPDSCVVWCSVEEGRWVITKDSESEIIKLEYLEKTQGQPGVFPWHSPHNHKVMENGWILSSSGKRLLWLPPSWLSDDKLRMWGGQFLALLHSEVPEVVILELLEE